mgnify:CR=1 FL=1
MVKKLLASILFLGVSLQGIAQFVIKGHVADSLSASIEGVAVKIKNTNRGTVSDREGYYELNLNISGQYTIEFSHIGYKPLEKSVKIEKKSVEINVTLFATAQLLEGIDVESKAESNAISSVSIQSATIENVSAPFNDITNILASLPSVVSNNELSSSYSVRGGNYDENMVRVNGIPVYKPFLIRAGQQEGLSFVNNDLVESVEFSAGGWDSKYGGKMSSLLLANYREATGWHGGATMSFLGGSAYLEGKIKEASFLVGVRHKRSRYLLNSLDVDGQYDPRFTDVQNYWKIPVTKDVSIETLFSYAANNYQVTPEDGQITFGTFNQELRFDVAFEGQQQMFYNTLQGAVKVNYELNEKLGINVIASMMQTYETENGDVEGGYRLCDIDKNIGSSTFNDCARIRGIGTLYNYARNNLEARIVNTETNGVYELNSKNSIEFGAGFGKRIIDSKVNEYAFTDSIGYVTISDAQLSNVSIDADEINFYLQHSYRGAGVVITYGAYASQNSLTDKFLISPRVLLEFMPSANPGWVLRLGSGIYRQQPLYRELLDEEGQLTEFPRAQSSWHIVAGMEHNFSWWGRSFNVSVEAYYKALWDLVPYQFENVRVQYYPYYSATGYATGFETRLAGEFIEGTESWFSFGLLSTKERIPGIDSEMVRRPSDQRLKIGLVFEDHIPNDPTLRVNLGLQYGSGLPIGLPGDITQRNLFTGDDYTRVDITFSKVFIMKPHYWDNIRLGIGIYNLLGSRNAITYTWIQDFSGQNFAVPNNLTGRLFNLIVSAKF